MKFILEGANMLHTQLNQSVNSFIQKIFIQWQFSLYFYCLSHIFSFIDS